MTTLARFILRDALLHRIARRGVDRPEQRHVPPREDLEGRHRDEHNAVRARPHVTYRTNGTLNKGAESKGSDQSGTSGEKYADPIALLPRRPLNRPHAAANGSRAKVNGLLVKMNGSCVNAKHAARERNG